MLGLTALGCNVYVVVCLSCCPEEQIAGVQIAPTYHIVWTCTAGQQLDVCVFRHVICDALIQSL